MIGLEVPRWLDALVGMQIGAGIFLGGFALLGWFILHVGGPSVDRAKAQLAREQADAGRHGWLPGADPDGTLATAGYRCFGHHGDLRRIMVSEHLGRRIRMADFLYVKREKLPSTSTNHLIAIELPVRLPDLVVSLDDLFDPMYRFDAESAAFNDKYFVACDDQRFCSAMVHPRMMEWLLAHELSFRISGNLLVTYSPTPWTLRQAFATLPVLSGIADLIPRFVLEDFGQAIR
ncbi:hypothetical protein [Kribbella sp. CA-294648]|uniref:hypothetical protein n=1 Tax=Kribbella sp. CA-294648 TaxID=3239948 RepID=UPI003D8D3AD3